MAEEKKFSGSNRPARKQAVPERKELPASQRRHAAKLADGATPAQNSSRPARQGRPNNNNGQGHQNNGSQGQKRTTSQNRPNNNGQSRSNTNNANRNSSRPGSRVAPSEGRPMVREKKNWSTKPRAGQVDYSAKPDNSLKQYVNESV